MMFTKEYKQAYLFVLLLITVGSMDKTQSQNVTTVSTSLLGPHSTAISSVPIGVESTFSVKSTSGVGSTNSVGSTSSVGFGKTDPTKHGKEPMEHNLKVIIIIAVCSAVFLIALVIFLLLCIFRRRRNQRLERERNLSYNNMNYESTVKFRQEGADGTTLGSEPDTTSPQKTNNNALRDAAYERVDLPSDKKPLNRTYENVTPGNVKETSDKAGPKHRYENVTPMVSSGNDKSKAPVGRYEEVFLDPPSEKNDDKKRRNDKYYENVELNI